MHEIDTNGWIAIGSLLLNFVQLSVVTRMKLEVSNLKVFMYQNFVPKNND